MRRLDLTKEEFLLRERARQAVYRALDSGAIKKPSKCRDCKKDWAWLQAHHKDYDRPLDVAWVCQKCHTARHAKGEGIKGARLEKFKKSLISRKGRVQKPWNAPKQHLTFQQHVQKLAKEGKLPLLMNDQGQSAV